MIRISRMVVLVLVLLAGPGAMMRFPGSASGDPPAPTAAQVPVLQGPKVRFLSLAEAIALARRPALVRRKPLTTEGEQLRNEMLKDVEGAYWDLYAAYWKLYSQEQGLRLVHRVWESAGGVYSVDHAWIRGRYELFRSQRLAAKEEVAKAEKELRKLLNLHNSDKTELVPCDAPSLAPFHPPAYQALVREALTRPEVRLARRRFAPAEIGQLLLPTLSAVLALQDAQLVGTRLPRPSCGFVGPAWEALRDAEEKCEQFLDICWRRLFEYDEQIRAQRAQRQAYGLHLRLEFERGGGWLPVDNTVLPEAARLYTEALANEYEAIANSAKNRCHFAFARGKILDYDRDRFGSDLLRAHVGKELLKRERKRTRFLVRRPSPREAAALERASAYALPGITASGTPVSLPALWKEVPPLREVGGLPDKSDQHGGAPVLAPYPAAELFPCDGSHSPGQP